MTASTPNTITDPVSLPGPCSSHTNLYGAPWRTDRHPTLVVHLPGDQDALLPTRPQWVSTLGRIDPDLAARVAACGSHGDLRAEFTPQGRRLVGGKCQDPLCAECGPQLAARESRLLSDAVLYLTAEEGIPADRFVFGAITMSHLLTPDTTARAELLEAALTDWASQGWFSRSVLGWAFAFDASGTLRRHRGVLHVHWHVLLVLRPGVDLEHFKEKSHDWFRKRLGRDQVRWHTDQGQWDGWLSPAHLTPTMLNGKPGFAWKGASEVGACSMKAGKHLEGYRNLYTRSEEDLKVLVPLIQKHGPMRQGGILAKVRAMLELRDEVHETATVLETKAMPEGFWVRICAVSRGLLLGVLKAAEIGNCEVRQLLHAARVMTVGEWEARVIQMAGTASN